MKTICISGFNGERWDPVGGTTHLGKGYRAYHPVLMRFSCPDSLSPFGGGGINLYVYCAGDPVNRSDPSGHMSTGQWIGMGVGLVAGFVFSMVTEGAAIPVVLTLMATAVGDAAIGAGTEMISDAVDQQRIQWDQVGMAAALGAVASLIGFGLGMAGKLKGTSNRPFGMLMMSGGNAGGPVRPLASASGGEVPALEQRAQQALAFIRDHRNFRHDLDMGTGEIVSSRINSETDTFFKNRYERDTWTFQENRRAAGEPFYMSDVVRYQYDTVSTMNGFRGRLPRLIIRENVTNMVTLDSTSGKTGDELFRTFFNASPNGKSTQRILNDFGLRAKTVERRIVDEYDDFGPDYHQMVNFYIPCEKI